MREALRPQALVVLPESHPWQEHVALHVGLRTGYCGSLTTFSAWLLQCVELLVGGTGRDGGQWAQVRQLMAALGLPPSVERASPGTATLPQCALHARAATPSDMATVLRHRHMSKA